jgi:hypothetical protein
MKPLDSTFARMVTQERFLSKYLHLPLIVLIILVVLHAVDRVLCDTLCFHFVLCDTLCFQNWQSTCISLIENSLKLGYPTTSYAFSERQVMLLVTVGYFADQVAYEQVCKNVNEYWGGVPLPGRCHADGASRSKWPIDVHFREHEIPLLVMLVSQISRRASASSCQCTAGSC